MTRLVDYQRLIKELKEKREEVGLNKKDLEFAIRSNNPNIKISSATIGRHENGYLKDINYITAFWWNETLEKLISQKNYKNLATEINGKNSGNNNPSTLSSVDQ